MRRAFSRRDAFPSGTTRSRTPSSPSSPTSASTSAADGRRQPHRDGLQLARSRLRDLPRHHAARLAIVMGSVTVIVVVVMVINLIVDVSYAFLDPRIRYGAGKNE